MFCSNRFRCSDFSPDNCCPVPSEGTGQHVIFYSLMPAFRLLKLNPLDSKLLLEF